MQTDDFCKFFAIGFSTYLEESVEVGSISEIYRDYAQMITFQIAQLNPANISSFMKKFVLKDAVAKQNIEQSANFLHIYSCYQNGYLRLFGYKTYIFGASAWDYNRMWNWRPK